VATATGRAIKGYSLCTLMKQSGLFLNLTIMKKLERQEMKSLKGGVADGGGGGCWIVSSSQGYQSCWYLSTSSNPLTLCERVYGNNCNGMSNAPISCSANNCIMN
jgi:hypothetical protein